MNQQSLGSAIDDPRLRDAFLILLERDDLPADLHVQFGSATMPRMKDLLQADKVCDRALLLNGYDSEFAVWVVTKLVTSASVEADKHFLAHAGHQGAINLCGHELTY